MHVRSGRVCRFAPLAFGAFAVALGLALCLAGSRATAPVLFGLGFLLTGPTAAELCGRWAALDGVSVQAAFVLGGLVGGGTGLAVYALGLLGTGLLVGALVAQIAGDPHPPHAVRVTEVKM